MVTLMANGHAEGIPPGKANSQPSFKPQRFNRIELGGFVGWIVAGDQPYSYTNDQSHKHPEPGNDEYINAHQAGDQVADANTENDAKHASKQTHNNRFDNK